MATSLDIENLKTKVGGPFSLSVTSEQITFISGASGTGKTVLLRAIADLDEHEGSSTFGSLDSKSTPADIWRKTVGLLLADSAWWKPTVKEHFLTDQNFEEIRKWASAINLSFELIDKDVQELSTGELSRWALLRLFSRKPKALLLDEPTANLDEDTTRAVEKFILDFITSEKIPALWVSHNQNQIKRIGGQWLEITHKGLVPLSLSGTGGAKTND